MIKLTATSLVLKKEAEDKLRELESESKIDYESLGLRPPTEEEDDFTEEDFELIYSNCYVDANEITLVMAEEDEKEGGCIIYTKNGLQVSVKESEDEVNHLRRMKNSFFYRVKNFVVSLKNRIFTKNNN